MQSSGADPFSGHDLLPRRSLVLELGRQEEGRPYYKACEQIQEKLDRLEELHANWRSRCREQVQAEKALARTLRIAEGRERDHLQEMRNVITSEMEEAEAKLPQLREDLEQKRERVDGMENEAQEIAKWLHRNCLAAGERPGAMPGPLPDKSKMFSGRPSPSALQRQDVAHGWA